MRHLLPACGEKGNRGRDRALHSAQTMMPTFLAAAALSMPLADITPLVTLFLCAAFGAVAVYRQQRRS